MQQLSIGHQSVSVALVTGMHNDTRLAMYPILHLSLASDPLGHFPTYHHPLAIKSDIGFITHLAGVVVLDCSVWSDLLWSIKDSPPSDSHHCVIPQTKLLIFVCPQLNIPHLTTQSTHPILIGWTCGRLMKL